MKVLYLFILFSLSTLAQSLSVVSIDKLTSNQLGSFFYPRFIKENTIAFSSPNYQGIWIRENNSQPEQLNDYSGAGYDFAFSSIDNSLLFRKNEYLNGKKYSTLISFDLLSRKEKIILENQQNILIPNLLPNSNLFYLKQNKLEKVSNSLLKNSDNIFVHANSEGLHVYVNSSEKILKPFGEGNYIWASISPDKQKILFNYPEKGTYVCDLNGNILFNVGRANYPSWSRDGNWILFMRDIDDGHEIIASDIYLKKYLGDVEINLTQNENMIELFPSYSPFSDEILFNSIDGEIYKITLKFN